ncbi:MAG: hypothetical protein SCARUB_04288 [Candidatus Scalindua rubra]|uniref:Uncharacterized protein n=1 Tax=Candidatus Scalindua rubra TaxID=1872076 RepID=A0A1E3X4L4_9BACT|nr:MAG: hypothetical protein SCARUB_04288 [Candidatus Scalindua rubra]
MIRFNCDMCGRSLVPEEDVRYVVKIEVYAACDSMEIDDDFNEELMNDFEEEDDEEMDNIDSDEIDSIEYKTFRYDLCSKCHSKYLQDPLSIKSIRRGRFSEN